MSLVISADDIKNELPGYTPDKAGDFHTESAKIADKRFDESLKSSEYKKVILMSGGPASGKTEFISEYLIDQEVLIFDGILPTKEGAKIKIDHIRKSNKSLKIYAVWPQELTKAYIAFLHRDRKYSDEYFYAKHASAREVLVWIATEYSDIEIKLFESVYKEEDIVFNEIQFDTHQELVAFLKKSQYTAEEILQLVTA